ncbi:phosphoglycerate dehydrogenase [Candidatus Sumerlaeota bacterium]|nr:phosphoglycerate dehydrogenase [Candidatus Sumerlaeota bacterium]
MKILVADKIASEGLEILKDGGNFEVVYKPEVTQDELAQIIGDFDALVVRSRAKAPAAVLEKGKNLKVVGRAGVGVDNVDVATATRLGVIVMNTPDGNTISAAEHAFSLLMAMARNIAFADKTMKEGKWEKKILTGVELYGKTLGVIGLGRIGKAVALRALAFEMRVLCFDPVVSPEEIEKIRLIPATLEEIIKESDFITIHTPLNDKTRGMIGEEQFKYMKKTARIINCARGGIVDETAVLKALDEGKIAGAALDVFTTEPLPEDSPLRKNPRLLLTPHLGASTVEAQEKVALQVAQQIVTYLKGGEVINAINAPSVDPSLLSIMRPYLNLAEKLGKFVSLYAEDRAAKINCEYSGAVLDYPLAPITTAAAKGFLEPMAEFPVNYINALKLAQERGMEIVETKISTSHQYANLISIEVTLEDGNKVKAAGTLYTKDMPRIVLLNDRHFNAIPEGNMLVIKNKDIPGVIGAVATILGKHKINIADMTWGRSKPHGDAMTIINTDQEITPNIVEEIAKEKNVLNVKFITV